MTRSESRTLTGTAAALFLAGVVRFSLEARGPLPRVWADTISVDSLSLESRADLDEAERRSAPLAPGERVDPNVASEEQLDRLPGIGPAAARAIIVSRSEAGGFTRAGDLARVSGIGSATVSRITPYLEFGAADPTAGARTRSTGTPDAGTGTGRSNAANQPRDDDSRLDLNRATEAELVGVSGIGPVLAGRIVAMRDQIGRFRRLEDLIDVRGIGPAKLRAVEGRLVVRR